MRHCQSSRNNFLSSLLLGDSEYSDENLQTHRVEDILRKKKEIFASVGKFDDDDVDDKGHDGTSATINRSFGVHNLFLRKNHPRNYSYSMNHFEKKRHFPKLFAVNMTFNPNMLKKENRKYTKGNKNGPTIANDSKFKNAFSIDGLTLPRDHLKSVRNMKENMVDMLNQNEPHVTTFNSNAETGRDNRSMSVRNLKVFRTRKNLWRNMNKFGLSKSNRNSVSQKFNPDGLVHTLRTRQVPNSISFRRRAIHAVQALPSFSKPTVATLIKVNSTNSKTTPHSHSTNCCIENKQQVTNPHPKQTLSSDSGENKKTNTSSSLSEYKSNYHDQNKFTSNYLQSQRNLSLNSGTQHQSHYRDGQNPRNQTTTNLINYNQSAIIGISSFQKTSPSYVQYHNQFTHPQSHSENIIHVQPENQHQTAYQQSLLQTFPIPQSSTTPPVILVTSGQLEIQKQSLATQKNTNSKVDSSNINKTSKPFKKPQKPSKKPKRPSNKPQNPSQKSKKPSQKLQNTSENPQNSEKNPLDLHQSSPISIYFDPHSNQLIPLKTKSSDSKTTVSRYASLPCDCDRETLECSCCAKFGIEMFDFHRTGE